MQPCEPVIFAVVVLPRHTGPALAAVIVAHGCAFTLMRNDTVTSQAVARSADGARGLYEFLSHKPLLPSYEEFSEKGPEGTGSKGDREISHSAVRIIQPAQLACSMLIDVCSVM